MRRYALIALFLPSILLAQSPFSTDSVLSYLKSISVNIGARPMGSPNERRAMEFAIAKFREFGLNITYIMDMPTAQNEITGNTYNTQSGIAVGILHGKTDRIIVIGGHIDSAGPNIPGANDDGSGAASVIELARVLSKEQHQSTLVFCLFGGEESGLCGSKYFVRQFPQIDSVALMLQIDMANGSDVLIPTIDDKNGSTPMWLVQAAYEECEKLGFSGLQYPTHFFTATNLLPGGGVGSDHQPFLTNGIPAIDFTSDMNDPIHTPQDDFEHFKPAGLKRSGDLVYGLIHRYDCGIPLQKPSDYYLVQVGMHPYFIPIWFLSLFNITSVVLATGVLFIVRKRRTELEKPQRPIIPALKLFLFALLIQTCVWLSENLVGIIKGVRYPWMAHPEGYFILGFLGAFLGISLSLKLTPHIKLSHDPYRWFLRATVFLLVLVILTGLVNAKVALYPAMGLFFLTLSMVVRRPWLKFVLWLLSPHFMFRFFFSEGFVFFGRSLVLHATQPIWMYAVLNLFYIVLFALWSFPFLLGFAAVYNDTAVDFFWLKRWRTNPALICISSLFFICAASLSFLPSYSDIWHQNIFINQSLDLNTGKGIIILKGNDYLKNLNVHLAEKDTLLSTWKRDILLKEFTLHRTPWISLERTISTFTDSNTTFDMLVKAHFKYRPLSFTLSYSSGKNKLSDAGSDFASTASDHSFSLHWESFPDTVITIPIHFRVAKADSVTETVEARFVELIEPIRIEKDFTNIVPQTTLRRTEVIKR